MNALMPALSRNPAHPKATALLAETLMGLGNLESAADCYGRGVELSPDDVDLRTAYGVALTRLGRFKEAAEQYTLALQRRPNDPLLYNNLGEVNRSRGQITESLFCFYKAIELDPKQSETHSNMMLTMQYDPSVSSEQLVNEGRFWAQRHAMGVRRLPKPQRDRSPERKLRVGFVSADLGRHPVGRFLEPVLQYRDPAQLETFCYSVGRVEDEQTTRLQQLVDHWVPATGLSNDDLAQKIRADEIDILIDLAGHTADNRLLVFAAKPAPVQASWAGYSGTTGLPEIDYVIADKWVIPKDEEQYFTERVIRLPHCYVPFQAPEPDVAVGPLPAASTGRITFGCFNNLAKITPAVLQLWADLLRSVPGSQLFLKTKALGDAGIRDGVLQRFAEHFIPPERLRLEGASPRGELLAAYNEVDIGLDPYPFNGGITTLESLWMGVPVVSMRGSRFVGHATESFLRNVGLDDWLATTRAEYLALAQTQAGDLAKLAKVRAGLRATMQNSPLAAGEPFARDFTAGLRKMWHAWCAAAE
jgi:predicted O-linked N-acetylglucosamine transferase (SPINDLY family)